MKDEEIKKNQLVLKKFDKGKQTLEDLLSMPTSFQNEGLGYVTNQKKHVQQTQNKNTHVPSSSKAMQFVKSHGKPFVHAKPHMKATNTSNSKIQLAGKRISRQNVHPIHMYRSSSTHLTCYHCGRISHTISHCFNKQKVKNVRAVWIPKYLIHGSTNTQGPKRTWVPQVTK